MTRREEDCNKDRSEVLQCTRERGVHASQPKHVEFGVFDYDDTAEPHYDPSLGEERNASSDDGVCTRASCHRWARRRRANGAGDRRNKHVGGRHHGGMALRKERTSGERRHMLPS